MKLEPGLYRHYYSSTITLTAIFTIGNKLVNIEERTLDKEYPDKPNSWFHQRFPIDRINFSDNLEKIRCLTDKEIWMKSIQFKWEDFNSEEIFNNMENLNLK